ncbi:large conductance mechanosensitive channel protein MscL [Brevibacterium daeguense]|uniref:Large-conductance mechanosensitive channel n=1 Tax=Brevibacterium daeguense TaxID=909936 RepID=A0ABP8EGI2_9MICO|nr:large conductance mechanosensitive channel protein MscL [Brevibacterium daeguense]
MFKGFRDFILRGNVIELATAVIIGAAFTAIVTAISDNFINPLLAAIGSPGSPALSFRIRPDLEATTIDLGAIITAVINFLIVAAVVYFIIIVPMNKLGELRRKGASEEAVPPTAEELLAEIRDLLATGRQEVVPDQRIAGGPSVDNPAEDDLKFGSNSPRP